MSDTKACPAEGALEEMEWTSQESQSEGNRKREMEGEKEMEGGREVEGGREMEGARKSRRKRKKVNKEMKEMLGMAGRRVISNEDKQIIFDILLRSDTVDINVISDALPHHAKSRIKSYLRARESTAKRSFKTAPEPAQSSPLEHWLQLLLPSSLNVACDHSYLLGDVIGICGRLDSFFKTFTRIPHYNYLYPYLRSLLRCEQLPKLWPTDAAVILHLMDQLEPELKSCDTEAQTSFLKKKLDALGQNPCDQNFKENQPERQVTDSDRARRRETNKESTSSTSTGISSATTGQSNTSTKPSTNLSSTSTERPSTSTETPSTSTGTSSSSTETSSTGPLTRKSTAVSSSSTTPQSTSQSTPQSAPTSKTQRMEQMVVQSLNPLGIPVQLLNLTRKTCHVSGGCGGKRKAEEDAGSTDGREGMNEKGAKEEGNEKGAEDACPKKKRARKQLNPAKVRPAGEETSREEEGATGPQGGGRQGEREEEEKEDNEMSLDQRNEEKEKAKPCGKETEEEKETEETSEQTEQGAEKEKVKPSGREKVQVPTNKKVLTIKIGGLWRVKDRKKMREERTEGAAAHKLEMLLIDTRGLVLYSVLLMDGRSEQQKEEVLQHMRTIIADMRQKRECPTLVKVRNESGQLLTCQKEHLQQVVKIAMVRVRECLVVEAEFVERKDENETSTPGTSTPGATTPGPTTPGPSMPSADVTSGLSPPTVAHNTGGDTRSPPQSEAGVKRGMFKNQRGRPLGRRGPKSSRIRRKTTQPRGGATAGGATTGGATIGGATAGGATTGGATTGGATTGGATNLEGATAVRASDVQGTTRLEGATAGPMRGRHRPVVRGKRGSATRRRRDTSTEESESEAELSPPSSPDTDYENDQRVQYQLERGSPRVTRAARNVTRATVNVEVHEAVACKSHGLNVLAETALGGKDVTLGGNTSTVRHPTTGVMPVVKSVTNNVGNDDVSAIASVANEMTDDDRLSNISSSSKNTNRTNSDVFHFTTPNDEFATVDLSTATVSYSSRSPRSRKGTPRKITTPCKTAPGESSPAPDYSS